MIETFTDIIRNKFRLIAQAAYSKCSEDNSYLLTEEEKTAIAFISGASYITKYTPRDYKWVISFRNIDISFNKVADKFDVIQLNGRELGDIVYDEFYS